MHTNLTRRRHGLGQFSHRLLFALLIALLIAGLSARAHGAAIGGVELTDQNGHPFRFESHRDQTILLLFGYTHCPDVCPLTLQTLRGTLDALRDDREAYLPVFVSVDPERDPPDRLAQYVAYFHQDILGLTGAPDDLRRLADQCRADFQVHDQNGDPHYAVDHSPHLYIIHPGGKLAGIIPHGITATDSADIVRSLAANP